jgi:AcrR family transcriptional regulator
MRKRAESKEETRRRIVEATMDLHEEVGPRATTISSIADRAGVQRLTVYRHFPDETAVFQACTAHWLEINPLPDPTDWSGVEPPFARFRAAVGALYDYYAGTRRMWAASYRDVDEVPALQQPMTQVGQYLDSVSEDLASAFEDSGTQQKTVATIRHVLHFLTWSDLESQGLDAAAKLEVVVNWLSGVRQSDGKPS